MFDTDSQRILQQSLQLQLTIPRRRHTSLLNLNVPSIIPTVKGTLKFESDRADQTVARN